MKAHLKITHRLKEHITEDLLRSHQFAFERVGFVTCRFALTSEQALLLLAFQYYPVADEDYIDDQRYGAVIDQTAFRKAMQLAYDQEVGIFHIHLHYQKGRPSPSKIDIRSAKTFVPDFFHVCPNLPHGALILSLDSFSGQVWYPGAPDFSPINRFTTVGSPLLKMEI